MFRTKPWTMAHAWKQVGRPIAEPYLKSELYGVEGGRYARMTVPDKPVPFYRYIAADLLENIGFKESGKYKQKALILATTALNELSGRSGRRLTDEQKQWAADAMLVLIFERDPSAIERLTDRSFRDGYFVVDPEMQTDVLRMLVDIVGPEVWEWADELDEVDWDTFCWRSTDEMDMATRVMTDLIPESTRASLRAWLDTPESVDEILPDISSASGPAVGPRPN